MRKIMIIGLIILISLLVACNNEDAQETEETEERIVTVEVDEVQKGDFVIDKTFYGRTSPNKSIPVMVQTPGEVDSIEVENGDDLDEDDIIAKISTVAGTQNVRATSAGQLINLQVDEGDMVSKEEPIAFIADLDTVKMQFSVTASAHSLFSVEDTVNVTVDNEEYEATITQIDTMPDDTGLYPVVATIESEEEDILPGTVAEVMVPEKKATNSLIVPTEAIVEEENTNFVYVVKDNTVEKKEVSILETGSRKTAIEGDVSKGEKVVVSGQLTLSDGIQVEITEGE